MSAGLMGGKGVPDSIFDHPRLFATLTAPSFGQVHVHRSDGSCHTKTGGRCRHGCRGPVCFATTTVVPSSERHSAVRVLITRAQSSGMPMRRVCGIGQLSRTVTVSRRIEVSRWRNFAKCSKSATSRWRSTNAAVLFTFTWSCG